MNLQTLSLRHAGEEHRADFAVVEAAELPAIAGQPQALLGESELAQFGTLRFPVKQHDFLLGRLAAKRALAALLSENDLRRIEIRSGVFGQPLVLHARAAGIEVTVAHSNGLAVALAYPGEYPIGVDVESVSAATAGTILGQLQASTAEMAWLAGAPVSESIACGVLWTAREALGKSMKTGLNSPLGVFALERIEPVDAVSWHGWYANFPRSRCLAKVFDARVLTVAMPAAMELTPWPRLR